MNGRHAAGSPAALQNPAYRPADTLRGLGGTTVGPPPFWSVVPRSRHPSPRHPNIGLLPALFARAIPCDAAPPPAPIAVSIPKPTVPARSWGWPTASPPIPGAGGGGSGI